LRERVGVRGWEPPAQAKTAPLTPSLSREGRGRPAAFEASRCVSISGASADS
jgi:hypothetical protein